jgi:hypothetical protein
MILRGLKQLAAPPHRIGHKSAACLKLFSKEQILGD